MQTRDIEFVLNKPYCHIEVTVKCLLIALSGSQGHTSKVVGLNTVTYRNATGATTDEQLPDEVSILYKFPKTVCCCLDHCISPRTNHVHIRNLPYRVDIKNVINETNAIVWDLEKSQSIR